MHLSAAVIGAFMAGAATALIASAAIRRLVRAGRSMSRSSSLLALPVIAVVVTIIIMNR